MLLIELPKRSALRNARSGMKTVMTLRGEKRKRACLGEGPPVSAKDLVTMARV